MNTHIYQSTTTVGLGRGRQLGFPTVNLVVPTEFTEQHGSYAAHVWLDDEQIAQIGVLFFGERLTLGIPTATLEIHLLDVAADPPRPTHVRFELVAFLRPPEKFETLDALIAAIRHDITRAREVLGKIG